MTLSLISILKYSVSINMHTHTLTAGTHLPTLTSFGSRSGHSAQRTHILETKVTLSSQVSQDRKRQREKDREKEEKEMTLGKKKKKNKKRWSGQEEKKKKNESLR